MKRKNYINHFIALFCGFIIISCSGSKVENPFDFIGYYPFNDNLMDMSGHYNHANKFGNSIKFDSGHSKTCIRFNNKNNSDNQNYGYKNDYLQLPNINIKNFTVAFWIKFEKNSNDLQSAAYSFGNDLIGNDAREFFVFWVSPNGMIWVFMQSGLSSVSTPQIDLSKGNWVHVAVTVSRDKIDLYQNGAKYYSKKIDFPHSFYNLPQYVAYHQWNNGKYSSSRFSGSIDELYIFNKVLNDDEINKLYKIE
jgi:hypothetical protein